MQKRRPNAGDDSGWQLIRCSYRHWFYNPTKSKDQSCPICASFEKLAKCVTNIMTIENWTPSGVCGNVFPLAEQLGQENQPGVFHCIRQDGHESVHVDSYDNRWSDG